MQHRDENSKKLPAGFQSLGTEDGYVILDSRLLDVERIKLGVSVRRLAELALVSPNTVKRMFESQRVQISKAQQVLEQFGIFDISRFLLREKSDSQSDTIASLDADLLAEWQVLSTDSAITELSNGLTFQRYRLVHSLMPNVQGRGKCYDLTNLKTREQTRVQEQLLRHPLVCRKLLGCPRFPVNERVLYSEDRSRFWVIDQWFDGISLEDKLRHGRLSATLLPRVMKQILEGLEALHAQGIIRRELSPRFIALIEPDGDVLFTELELAKILQGTISVSEDWHEDPYRAPGVEADEVDRSVDFYSWAQILIHAVTGTLPSSPAKASVLDATNLPEKVKAIADRCLSLSHRRRPSSATEIARHIEAWTQ